MARANANEPTNRPKRIPVSAASRDILTVEHTDDSFVYRWVNDSSGRIQKFINGGYVHVTKEDAGMIGSGHMAGDANTQGEYITKYMGQETVAYLMRIPKHLYDEDQQAKHRQIDEVESRIYGTPSASSGLYGSVTKS